MNLIGLGVIHHTFGRGLIFHHQDPYIRIKFDCGVKEFLYPHAFARFLVFEDKVKQERALLKVDEMSSKKSADENKPGFLHLGDYDRATNLKRAGTKHLNLNTRRSKRASAIDVASVANLAFKCTYCDGGQSAERLGFYGPCSPDLILYNIKKSSVNSCKKSSHYCSDYLAGKLAYDKVVSAWEKGLLPCESCILRDWEVQTGLLAKSSSTSGPSSLRTDVGGKLGILTTRQEGETEADRVIFALFLIDEAMDSFDDYSKIMAHPMYRINLTPKEAKRMPYWKYHKNNNVPEKAAWGTGMYRYIEDTEAMRILYDVMEMKRGTEDAGLAAEFFYYYSELNDLPSDEIKEASGALTF